MRSNRVFGLVVLALAGLGSPPRAGAHGSFHEEAARIDALIREAPADGGLWHQLAWLQLLHGDWQQALLDVEKAERLAPGRFPFGYVRGKALAEGGKVEAARAVLDEFLREHPEHAGAWIERARVLRRTGLIEESISDLRTALAKTPDPEPDLYVELAQAVAERAQPDEAVQVLEQGVAKIGNTPSLVLKIVQIEAGSGKFDRALTRLEAMQKMAPRPEPWMAERAELLTKAGRNGEARAAWAELRDRIRGLPEPERASHAMSVLAEQADKALNKFNPTAPATTFK